jgi:hypothetical protein
VVFGFLLIASLSSRFLPLRYEKAFEGVPAYSRILQRQQRSPLDRYGYSRRLLEL